MGSMFEEGKKVTPLIDEDGKKFTITIPKWEIGSIVDAFKFIQQTYNRICGKWPHRSRREKGEILRTLVNREALKNQKHKDYLSDL